MSHHLERCRQCLAVTSQCRCFDCNKEERLTLCDKCKALQVTDTPNAPTPTTPATDALGAAVEEARDVLLLRQVDYRQAAKGYEVSGASRSLSAATDALVAAVEARAVARAERVCEWEYNAADGPSYQFKCGGAQYRLGIPNYCPDCGGRVRVVGS